LEIDVVERRIRQLEIERVALAKETDDASRERLAALEEELANLSEQKAGMVAHWQSEKEAISQIRALKEQLEEQRTELERAPDLERAAEIRYGVIPELERQVGEATKRLDELQAHQRMLKEEVDEEDIAEVVSKWTGVPVSRLMEGEMHKLLRLEEVLHERVVGQEEAVQAVANAVRRRPYAVVLLDEIEKAHPEVFNVLLQLLDDGRLTDGQGRTVDFTNVVLIMTSNLPGDPKDFFKPEFINRIDDIVHFRSLTEDDLSRIVEIQLGHLRERLAARRI